MKRNYIPGTTTRFFGIVLLLICTVGLSHYSQVFQWHTDTTRLEQGHAQQYLQYIDTLYQNLKYDRKQLMDARIKSVHAVDRRNLASVQAAETMREHYLHEFKNSLITLGCVLKSVSGDNFHCADFSLTVRRLEDGPRLRRIDYQYMEIYKLQSALYAQRLDSLRWAAVRNDQARQRIFYGFLLLQIWGIWMVTYGEMLSRSQRL